MRRFCYFLFAICGLLGPVQAGTLSIPAVDNYNVRVGTETFEGQYKFTTNTLLVETAQAIYGMGSDVIKFYMGSDTNQTGVWLPPTVTNMVTMARDSPSFAQVFSMPFQYFVVWVYPLGHGDEWWGSGYNSTDGAIDYKQMYDLTCYFLTNFNNSGKTFYLGHWEGDGYLKVNGWTTNPSPTTIQGMIGWLNNRQQAVDDAKAATPHTNVNVFNYAECNRVRDAMLNGTNNNQRVINYVVPYVTNLDYLSYSSYDAQNLDSSDLYTTLNYMQAHLPTNKVSSIPGMRMWIGEYGWGGDSPAAQEPLARSYIQRLLGWNYNGGCLQHILFWEIYNNQTTGGTNYFLISPSPTNSSVPSYAPCYYLHQYFLNDARLLTAQFNETNGSLPSETQFSALISPLLNSPLAAPVNLALTSPTARAVGSGAALVSATLAQGVYGDDEATVSVFWGTQNGGTNSAAWQNSAVMGVNTNFNPATFTTVLTNFASQGTYFISFCASNASAQTWASAGSVTIGPPPPQLNPGNYAYRVKLSFPGYQGPALGNFPALVALSATNIPGFSFSQFQANGSDLRFTDSGGVNMLPFEIDEWNQNGVSTVWVQVPVLGSSSIWAYWGNPNETDVPPASSNVWVNAGYQMVYHLKENGFPFADSTGRYPATRGVAPTQSSGIIGHGVSFNGSSQYISPGTVTLSNQFTTYAWINLSSNANNVQAIWANQVGGYGSNGFSWFVDTFNSSDRVMHFDSGNGAGSGADPTGSATVGPSKWHLAVATWDQVHSTVNNYLDGNANGSGTAVPTFGLGNQLNLGAFLNPTFYWTGLMDEARVQVGVASPSWISATYLNVSNPAAFVSFSSANFGPPVLQQDISPLYQTISYTGLEKVTYSVGVNGSAPFSYQWFQNGSSVPGATNSSYTFTALPGTNTYYVTVTNAYTASFAGGAPVTSSTATVVGGPTLAPSNYSCRMRINFPGYTGQSTLTNFPALVQFSNGLPGFSYSQFASPTGGDLAFADSSGLVPLPYEINQWNPAGVSSVWVQLPSLSGTNTFIWAYWGNPAATNPTASTTNGSVWLPQYQLVWHLEQSGFPYLDSTTQFPATSGVAPAVTTGEIGNAGLFNNSDYLAAGPVNVGNAFTLFAWVKPSATGVNIQTVWANKPAGWNSAGFALYVNTYNTTNQALVLEDGDGTAGDLTTSPSNLVTPGVWHCVAAAVNRSAGAATLYVDGASVVSGAVVTDLANNSIVNLGRFTNNSYHFNGSIDEARIAAGVCSADWIAATAANGSPQTGGSFDSFSQVNPRPTVSLTTASGAQFLNWPNSAGVYVIYTTTNLASPWTPATNAISYTNGLWEAQVFPPAQGSQFYRLQTE